MFGYLVIGPKQHILAQLKVQSCQGKELSHNRKSFKMKSLKDIINNFQHSYDNLLKNQNLKRLKQGCYVYELEADTTITSEYILLMHFLGKIEIKLQEKMVKYILSKQNKEGGWPLFYDGETDLSASVKAYYALKLAGLDEKSQEMIKAKNCILLKLLIIFIKHTKTQS